MTWTAPEPTRTDWPTVASERELLEGLLDWHRSTLLTKCAGLTVDQLKRCAIEPSGLSLLGIVRHVTDAERHWSWDFAGMTDWTFAGFEGVPDADAAADLVAYTETCQRSRDLVAAASLDDVFLRPERNNRTFSLRWMYLHMIEEYADTTAMPTCSGNGSMAPPASDPFLVADTDRSPAASTVGCRAMDSAW